MPPVSSRMVVGEGLTEVSLRTKFTTTSKELSIYTIVSVVAGVSPGDGHNSATSSARRTPVC